MAKMNVRIRGPFSLAIFLLALFETLHWSLAAGDINSPDFFEREVDNLRHTQASFLSSGDTIVRIATKLAERETGRKYSDHGSNAFIHRKWGDLDRDLGKRQHEISSRSLKISQLSSRNTAHTDSMLKSRGQARTTSAAEPSPNATEGAASSHHNVVIFAVLYMSATIFQLFGSATPAGSSMNQHIRRRAFVSPLLVLPLLLAPVFGSTQLDAHLPLPSIPSTSLHHIDALSLPSAADGATVYISAPLEAPPTDCDLQCWLNRLMIHIPDQKFSSSWLGVTVTGTVSKGVCTGLTLGDLQSSLVPPAGVGFDVAGLSIQCALDWGLSVPLLPALGGSANAVVNNSKLALTLQLQKDADGLASAANLTTCTPKIVVSSIEFQGDFSTFLDLLRTEVASVISNSLNGVICTELTKLVQTNLTNVLQDADMFIRPFLKPRPPVVPPVYPPGMMDLRKSSMLAVVDYVLDDVVGADGILGLNKIVNALTNNTGRVAVSNIGLSVPIPVASLGVVTFGLHNVSISGLNTWGLFDVLEPEGHYNLTSRTQLDTFALSVAFSVNVSVNGTLGDTYLYEEAVLIAGLENNTLHSSLQVAINDATVRSLTDNQIIVPGCLLSTVHDLNMTQLDFSFVLAQLQILATNGGTEEQLDTAINNVFALLTQSFQPAIPALFNGLVAGPVRLLANVGFGALLEANTTCTNPSSPETFNRESTIAAFSGAGGVFAVLLALTVAALFISQMPSSSPSDEESNAPLINDHRDRRVLSDDAIDGVGETKEEEETDGRRSKWLNALIFTSRFPAALRYGVLLLLLSNIALFISSNTSVGASVYMYVTMGGEQTKLPSLFDFSLGNSVVDMWHAEVYALSLLIAVFSGAWPYLKLVMLLLCWIVPVNLLTRKNRERVLMSLDVLGKWSLIDAFVLTLMMVAFHFRIVPPVSPHTPPGTARVDAYVEPHWGFYSFLIATMLSLASTHVVLACHRLESAPKPKPKAPHLVAQSRSRGAPGQQKHKWEALCSYAFKSNCVLSRFSWLVTAAVTFLLLFSIALLITGSVIDSFQFQFRGAFQLLLNFLQEDSFTSYSIISTGLALPSSALNPDSFGVRFIQVTWFSFAIAIPLCYLLLLLVLWLTPLTPRLQRGVFVVTEVFNAWSALEVVVVSIVAALLELQQFSQFIIGSRCDIINPLLAQYFGPYLDGDTKCFDVIATLDDGCFFLFAACAIYIIVGLGVQIACHKALREREGELAEAEAAAHLPININGPDFDGDYVRSYFHDAQED